MGLIVHNYWLNFPPKIHEDGSTHGLGTAAFILGMQPQVLGRWQEITAWAQTEPDSRCLPQTDGLIKGVQHGLVGLNWVLHNKNHPHTHTHKTQGDSIQLFWHRGRRNRRVHLSYDWSVR